MGLFIGVDEQGQGFSQLGQGMRFVLADLIDYLIEHCRGLSIVLLGAQHAERNESTKPPIGGVGFADKGGRHGYFLQWSRLYSAEESPVGVKGFYKPVFRPSRSLRRIDKGDCFALVPSVDTKILVIDSDNAVAWIELAHADEAKVSEIGLAVGIAARENRKLG
jgi:hypothetical protein